MIVISRNFGQLGNRLVLAANLIAAAQEYGVTLLNPSFSQYAAHFRSTKHDLWCRFEPQPAKPNLKTSSDTSPRCELPSDQFPSNYEVISFRTTCCEKPTPPPILSAEDPREQSALDEPSSWQREFLYRAVYLTGRSLSHLRMTQFPFQVLRLGHHGECDLTSESFARLTRSRRPILASGWRFKAGHLLTKHSELIRDHFRVSEPHEDAVEHLMSGIRRDSETVIGVHIRQGDYATFRGGKYFYSTADYAAAMRRIQAQSQIQNPGKDIAFLVCSNSKLHQNDFAGLNVRFGTGQMVEDMYAFAKCDHLVGPPSTFTGWASFYGNVPLHRMTSAGEPFDQMFTRPRLTYEQTLAAA